MKRILLLLALLATLAALPSLAQDTGALEERINKLNGYVQDLLEDKANQKRQIESLAKEVQSLREQLQSQPKGSYATQEDLRALARQVQEVENNRQADYEKIIKQIENLGRASARPAKPVRPAAGSNSGGDLPDKAIEHTIASGDTLSTIAAAYSKEKGVKITIDQIRKANPGIKDDKLVIGRKILVPLPDK